MAKTALSRRSAVDGLRKALARLPESTLTWLPGDGHQRKYEAELQHWVAELEHLRQWFVAGTMDWWGIPSPSEQQKETASDIWSANAIATMHKLRPAYLEELQIPAGQFTRQRVLEVGCGPLVPVLQFEDCERHGVDPLANRYLAAGWPLFALDVTVVSAKAESMPYPDDWFDNVISVNALDHVDDFRAVAAEILRVLKPGGQVFFEVEYHHPTVTEPVQLDDGAIKAAFGELCLTKVREIDASQLYSNLVERFGLSGDLLPHLGSSERYATWHGVSIA